MVVGVAVAPRVGSCEPEEKCACAYASPLYAAVAISFYVASSLFLDTLYGCFDLGCYLFVLLSVRCLVESYLTTDQGSA